MIVGSDKVYAIENFYVKYMTETGAELSLFSAQTMFYDYYQKSTVNKLFFKAGLSGILIKINRLFREAVIKYQPDVIWVFKGMEIFPESLVWAKQRGIKLVNYNPDNPFIFTGKGSGNKYVVDAIPLYDLHFTYNLHIEQQLQAQYNAKTAYLPFGYDLSDALFEECAAQPELVKVCFLGNPDHQRAAFINQLAAAGIALDLYGNSWEKFVQHRGITIFPPVYGDELWKVLRKYRIQLNMMRVHNEDSHNMRTFEVPGVGGIMVAPDTSEHRTFFNNGKEAFLYNGGEDCAAVMSAILALPVAAADEIRKNARTVSLQKGYDYKNRAAQALSVIKNL